MIIPNQLRYEKYQAPPEFWGLSDEDFSLVVILCWFWIAKNRAGSYPSPVKAPA